MGAVMRTAGAACWAERKVEDSKSMAEAQRGSLRRLVIWVFPEPFFGKQPPAGREVAVWI